MKSIGCGIDRLLVIIVLAVAACVVGATIDWSLRSECRYGVGQCADSVSAPFRSHSEFGKHCCRCREFREIHFDGGNQRARECWQRENRSNQGADRSRPRWQQFQAAQGQLGGALSRLLVVAENYPQLRANQNFQSLQAQMEGTENRISVARGNFNEACKRYNTTVRGSRQSLCRYNGISTSPLLQSQPGAEKAPTVNFNFGNTPSPAPAATPYRRSGTPLQRGPRSNLRATSAQMSDLHSERVLATGYDLSAGDFLERHVCLQSVCLYPMTFAAEIIPPKPDRLFQ